MNVRNTYLAALASCFAFAPAVARAQSSGDLATAEALFDEGKRAMAEGRYEQACPKLEASLRLDVGIGAMLYLAECDLHLGKTATSWGLFREATALAASRHDERERLARERADRLTPRLSRLVVDLAGCAEITDLVVRRDGNLLDRAVWGTAVPVDPGPHAVEVSAPGRVPYRTSVTIVDDGSTSTITVPALATPVSPAPPVPAATVLADAPHNPPAPHARPLGTQRTVALATGGVAVVALGLGAYWALLAKSDLDGSNSDGHCQGNNCDSFGVQARSDAQTHAARATIALVAGAAATGAGAVLWLTAPRSSAQLAVVPSVGPSAWALTFTGKI